MAVCGAAKACNPNVAAVTANANAALRFLVLNFQLLWAKPASIFPIFREFEDHMHQRRPIIRNVRKIEPG
jgi:hypothetical protein